MLENLHQPNSSFLIKAFLTVSIFSISHKNIGFSLKNISNALKAKACSLHFQEILINKDFLINCMATFIKGLRNIFLFINSPKNKAKD